MKTLRNGFLALLLALFTLPAFAQQPTQAQQDQFEATVNDILTSDVDSKDDYVLTWLQQTFGDVVFSAWDGGASPTGVDATLLTHAVGFTNVVALILGIVIMGYVVIAGAIHTAASGEVLGKNWSTVWLPLRIAVALGMITPVIGAKGIISAVQALVMSLIVIGSNAGSLLWSEVVKRITEGDAVTAVTPATSPATVKTIFQALVCAEWTYRYEGSYSDGADVAVAKIYKTNIPVTGNGLRGPVSTANWSAILDENVQKIAFGDDGDCGSISFSVSDTTDNSAFKQDYSALAAKEGMNAARREMLRLINNLAPFAAALIREEQIGGYGNIQGKIAGKENSFDKEYGAEIGKYQEIVEDFVARFPEEVTKATTGNSRVQSMWKEQLNHGGWGAAGRWFFEISRFHHLNHSIISSVVNSVSMPTNPNFCGFMGFITKIFSNCEKQTEAAAADITDATALFHNAATRNIASSGRGDQNARVRASMAAADEAKDKDMASLPVYMSKSIAQGILSAVVWNGESWTDGMHGSGSVRDTSSLANPFRTVTAIGETINGTAMTMWVAAGFIEVKGGIAGAVPGAGGGLKAFAHWVSVTLTSMVVALIPMGFILSYLLPFLPIITWIRLLVAYLLTAIEAVVAAPLAVIMMVTPEGEGIAGTRLERAIQMLAAIILKPTLLVIGLIAALTLSYVSFGIVNTLFWQVAASMTDFAGVFEILAILVIYTSLVFQVSKGAIVIMQKLPDQILDWMAGGVGGRSFGDDAEHGVSSSMSETKGSLGTMSGSLSRTVSDRNRARMNSPKGKDDESENG